MSDSHVTVFTTPTGDHQSPVGLQFIESLPVGAMFCASTGLAWIKLNAENRCMYLDGTGIITPSHAIWGEMVLHKIVTAKFEY